MVEQVEKCVHGIRLLERTFDRPVHLNLRSRTAARRWEIMPRQVGNFRHEIVGNALAGGRPAPGRQRGSPPTCERASGCYN